MSEIVKPCPKCNAQLELTSELVGCLLECPACGVQFSIDPVIEHNNNKHNISAMSCPQCKIMLDVRGKPVGANVRCHVCNVQFMMEAHDTEEWTPEKQRLWQLDSDHRKKATQLKREKRYLEAVDELLKAREYVKALGRYSPSTRIAEYMMMAEKYHEAAVECITMYNEVDFSGQEYHKGKDGAKASAMYVAHEAFRKMGNVIMGAAFLAGSKTAGKQMEMHELTRYKKPTKEITSVRGIKKAMEDFYFISEGQKRIVEKILVEAWFSLYNADPMKIAQNVERELSQPPTMEPHE